MGEERTFSGDAFGDPPAHLWPGYFWLINDKVDEEKLLGQLRDMYSHGARSVCLLPEPPEFRPRTMGTELDVPYLGEEYFKVVRRVVEECGRLGMNYWLYDEGGWPSGGACGQVYAMDPERHARKVVTYGEFCLGPGERYEVPEGVLCAATKEGGSWRVHLPGEVVEGPPEGARLRTFLVSDVSRRGEDAPYVDVLCPSAVRTFLMLTHERYRRHIGGSFGRTVRFTFTDEPAAPYTSYSLGQLTWTDDMAEEFRLCKGYDLIGWLPWLLEEPSDDEDPEVTKVRVDFYDVWSQLFVERYLIPIRDWCRANGLLSAGHFGGEDEPRYNADAGYGHILRAMRGLDVPGVDAIWRQLFPGVRSHQFPKYASSVARQKGQPYVLTESFAVYGNGLTPAQMKWVTDQQYLRGASLMVVACYPYSTRGHLMPGERPHFGPVNPLWKYMDVYHAYTARLGYLLTRGRAVCSTAVYYDVRSIWAGASRREEAIRLHDLVADVLLRSQCDYDYVDDDVLSGREGKIREGKLVVGEMEYDTLIVPATRWMEEGALEGLAEFVRSGGRLVVVEGMPYADGGRVGLEDLLPEGVERVISAEPEDLPSFVEPVVVLDPPCPDVRATKRSWEGGSLYFLTNEGRDHLRLSVSFPERGDPALYDPEDGRIYSLEAERCGEGVRLELEVHPWGSALVAFGVEAEGPLRKFVPDGRRIPLEEGWKLRPLRRYVVGERDFEVTQLLSSPVPAKLGDWAEFLGGNFSGDAEYSVSFDCPPELSSLPAVLVLGDVRYACEVELNGERVGRRIWESFSLDVSGKLRPGRNELKVVVTNTLANAILDPEVLERWDKVDGPGWNIFYHKLARKFERDSLPSGLFGPVRVEFGSYG